MDQQKLLEWGGVGTIPVSSEKNHQVLTSSNIAYLLLRVRGDKLKVEWPPAWSDFFYLNNSLSNVFRCKEKLIMILTMDWKKKKR